MESTNNIAPIILFVYRRLDHMNAVVEALKANPEARYSTLYVYSDAAANASVAEDVKRVREYAHGIMGFKDVIVIERESNWGIERSEVDGVTTVLNKHGKAIVLEDDIQVGNQFLKYMNYCLDEYQDDKRIYTITGYSFLKSESGRDNVFGLTRSFCAWGWGTWSDRWQNLRRSLDKSDVRFVAAHKSRLDNGQDFSYLLLHQYKNHCLTWDVTWYYSCCKNAGMTIFPYNSLVNNIGMDGSGVHYSDNSKENRIEPINARERIEYPIKLADTRETLKKVVVEKRAADPKPISKKLKMFARFWVNVVEILIAGDDSVTIR